MLGDNIKKYRRENKISQEALGEKLGVSRQSISLWENNQTQPSLENIVALAKIFNVTTDALLAEEAKAKAEAEAEVETQTDNSTPPKKPNKKLLIWSIVAACTVLITVALLVLRPWSNDSIFSKPFLEDTEAIATVEKSVVKIICYDYDGKESATGSGFILFDEKIVVTNYHVMESAYTCKISTNKDISYNVDGILAYSKENDLAILSLEMSTGEQPLKIGDSEDVKKGESIMAIGNPLGIENVISQGVISGKTTVDNMESILFTAPISHGSSGGALFNSNGEVIGITYGSYTEGQNLNLAIPIEAAEKLYSGKTEKKSVDTIYKEIRPYFEYLSKYSDAIPVTLEELRSNPKLYKNKIVKVTAYMSSSLGNDRFHITDQKEYISGNYVEDSVVTAFEYTENSTPFKRQYILLARHFSKIEYTEENLECGDIITIIGKFKFTAAGESEYSDLLGKYVVRETDDGEIDAYVSYKER